MTRQIAWTAEKTFWSLIAFTVLVKLGVIWAGATLFYHADWAGHIFVDVWGWNEFVSKCQMGLIPYLQIPKEYPVGAGALYWLFSRFLPANYTSQQLLLAHAVLTAAADIFNVGIFYSIARQLNPPRAGWVTLFFILNATSLVLSPVRFESYVVLFVMIGYYFHKAGMSYWAVFFWSLGFSVKWFPVFFIVAQEVQAIAAKRKWQWAKSGAIFALVTGALNLPFILLNYLRFGNVDNWLWTYVFHMRRPLYWDTLLGVGELWLGVLSWEKYAAYGSGLLVLATFLYRPRMAIEYKAVLSCVAALVCNRSYSTQFHLWFYPFLLLIACLEPKRQMVKYLALFVALDVTNILVYPFFFASSIQELHGFVPLGARFFGGHQTILFSAAVCARSLFLIVLGVFVANGPDEQEVPSSVRSGERPKGQSMPIPEWPASGILAYQCG